MKLLDFVYAHVYSWYLRMYLKGRKVDPQSCTTRAFVLGFVGLTFVGVLSYNLILGKNVSMPHGFAGALGALIAGGLVNEYYSWNDRYLKVYNKYTANGQIQIKGREYLLAWLFLLWPYPTIILLAIFKTPI